jgi:hypothetical protein
MHRNIAERWLTELARATNEKDLGAHQDLVSRALRVIGPPGDDALDYANWLQRRRQQFTVGEPACVRFDSVHLTASLPGRLMFKTVETVEQGDGRREASVKEIIIQKEDDGKWRALQERFVRAVPHREIAAE